MVRRISLWLALALILAACTGTSTGTTAPPADGSTSTTAESTTPTEGSQSTTTTSPPPTWTELPGTEGLPPEVQEELMELVTATQQIRGLHFAVPPTITVVSEQEMESRIREMVEEETGDLPADEALYRLLGLIDEEADLETLLSDLYGEGGAAFYDSELDELVVQMDADGFSPNQRSFVVHELTHALTDQRFDYHPIREAMIDEQRYDEASAYLALIEGDATLAMLLHLQGLSQRELGEYFAEALSEDTSAFDALPEFLRDSFTFSYDSGLAFVQRLYDQGGWDAVNEAYGTMPGLPGSSEQIITPSDYGRDLPVEVTFQPPTIPGYDLEYESVWGELGFRLMLDQELGESVGVEAADGWGGDTYFQWFDGQNAAFLILCTADTERDLEELEDALLDYAFGSVAEEDFVWVEEVDGELMFVAADDPEIGALIRDSVRS